MPWVGFESTIPAFEWKETVHALDRAATVIGRLVSTLQETRCVSIQNTNWIILYKEIIATHSEKDTKPINKQCAQSSEFVYVKAPATLR
jgi:hypothetical protein